MPAVSAGRAVGVICGDRGWRTSSGAAEGSSAMNLNTLRGIASVVIVFTLVDGALHVLGFPYSFTIIA